MENIVLGCSTLVVIFLLAIVLGLEMKINALARQIDDKLNQLIQQK